jgi:hypothetical protein
VQERPVPTAARDRDLAGMRGKHAVEVAGLACNGGRDDLAIEA